jgi:hypothetical protein
MNMEYKPEDAMTREEAITELVAEYIASGLFEDDMNEARARLIYKEIERLRSLAIEFLAEEIDCGILLDT